jgi:hypothetical protein
MCNIGEPVNEVIVVEPLKTPVPLPGVTPEDEPKPVRPVVPTVIPVPAEV